MFLSLFFFVVVQAQVLGSADDSSEFLLKPFDFFGRGEREDHSFITTAHSSSLIIGD